MSNTLKTILITISVLVWTGIVALGSMVVTWTAAEYEFIPQIEAAQEEASYWKGFSEYCHEDLDGTILGEPLLEALEEGYEKSVNETND